MRIVVGASSHPLPVTNGMRLHLANLLTELRTRHDVTLVTVPRPGDDTSAAALEPLCSSYRPVPGRLVQGHRLRLEVATLFRRQSIVVADLLHSGLPEAVHAAVREVRPDVVHLETGACAAFAPGLEAPVVVAALDADDLNAAAATAYAGGLVRRAFAAREARRWHKFERSAYAGYDVVVVSERDAEVLRAADPRLRVHIVPNGVDARVFTPPSDPRQADTVLLTGAMDYPPNIDAAVYAATEVLPLLRAGRPAARLVLAGRDPDPRVRALAGAYVDVTGTLPDLRPLLRSAAVYLCPMRLGSGIKNKLLEALACGCPAVATTLATAGLGAVPGRDLLVADDPAALAAALDRVLGDPALAAGLGRAARTRAEALSWQATAAGYERIYAQAAAGRADN